MRGVDDSARVEKVTQFFKRDTAFWQLVSTQIATFFCHRCFSFFSENETRFSFFLCVAYSAVCTPTEKLRCFWFGSARWTRRGGGGECVCVCMCVCACVCVCVWCEKPFFFFFTRPHFSREDSLFGFELTRCQEQNNCLLIEPSAAIQSAKVNTSADQIWISF